jgi:hypothetical protein
MAPDVKRRPAGNGTAKVTTDQEVTLSLPEQARRLVEEADCAPPCDLVTWAEGYIAGWDAAVSAVPQCRADELAEMEARLHDRSWIDRGRMLRDKRIARELAEMEAHAARIRAEIYGGAA